MSSLLDLMAQSPKEATYLMNNWVKILFRDGMLGKKQQIIRSFRSQLLAREGLHHIKIISAREPDSKLLAILKKRFGEESIVEVELKPELVSGIQIVVDGEAMIDGSLGYQLSRLLNY